MKPTGYKKCGSTYSLKVVQSTMQTQMPQHIFVRSGWSLAACTHPVPLADSAGVLEVPGPRESQGAALKVPVGEHVGQAKGVVVLLWKRKNNNSSERNLSFVRSRSDG